MSDYDGDNLPLRSFAEPPPTYEARPNTAGLPPPRPPPMSVTQAIPVKEGLLTPSYGALDKDSCKQPPNQEPNSSTAANIDKIARRKLIIASVLCLFFMIGEVIGGAIAGSLAIMTDAAHLLTDFASFMISLLAIFLASLPATKKMSFGWHRAEIVGALVSVLMIWVVTGILVYLAIMRLVHGDYEIHAKAMLITSAIGVGVNIIMAATLHQHSHSHASGTMPPPKDVSCNNSEVSTPACMSEPTSPGHAPKSPSAAEKGTVSAHSHGAGDGHGHGHGHSHASGGHGHSHGDESNKGGEQHEENINVRAAFIHVVGDFVQSLGVFIAALIIFFKPQYKMADPICTFIFSILVLLTTVSILRETMHVLMEGTPKSLDFNEVKRALYEVPGVIEVHNLRMWSLTTTKTAVSVHLEYDDAYNSQAILKQASRKLRHNFRVHDVTIQMEPHVAGDIHEAME